VEPVLNWGGFVNQSFRLSDGRSAALLKLASSQENHAQLERWRRSARLLSERYRAPRMIGWIDLAGTASRGPVFEWLEGSTPLRLDELPVPAVISLFEALHSDSELASLLRNTGESIASCRESYRKCYHRRFVEDLEFIATAPPPFLQQARLEWMHSEALALEADVARSEAFAEAAGRPVHADLWLNNLLVGAAGAWWVVDWDGLGLGDPVMDWAMLFGPSRGEIDGHFEAAESLLALAPAARKRLRTYERASRLDWIIDPLSDWIQAASEPFHGEAIRFANERVHREALAVYEAMYGSS
jgi:hypothetical protein